MIAVDTNVFVRLLVDDPGAAQECANARRAASEAGSVYVAQAVQIEAVWVLDRAYRLPKSTLADALGQVADNAAYVLQRPEVFRQALDAYRSGSADFSDYVILAEAGTHRCLLATFDRKLGRERGSRRLEG